MVKIYCCKKKKSNISFSNFFIFIFQGSNPEYLDKNYGGVFIIWDKIFGTFEPGRALLKFI